MHPLLRYAKDRDIRQAELAKRLGISPQFLSDVIHGRSYFSREKALRAVEITGGAVTLAELLTFEPRDAA